MNICSVENCWNNSNLYSVDDVSIYLCNDHNVNNLKPIKYKACQESQCAKRAYYNVEYKNFVEYCKKHKTNDMVRINNKTCLHLNCLIHPCYNNPGLKNGLYCKTHALNGMINIKKKPCIHPECKTMPCFGFPKNYDIPKEYNIKNNSIRWCALHAPQGTQNLKAIKCLLCNVTASFGDLNDKKKLYCYKHKLKEHVYVK